MVIKSASSRISFSDKWSTHPGITEREKFISKLDIPDVDPIDYSPWSLFRNPLKIQEKLTDLLFSNVKYEGPVKTLDLEFFKEKYYSVIDKNSFNKEYKGYYNNRRIKSFDQDELKKRAGVKSFSQLFTDENCSLTKSLNVIDSELQLLQTLEINLDDDEEFEFDGKKFSKKYIPEIIRKLEQEKIELNKKADDLDKLIFSSALSKTDDYSANRLLELYQNYIDVVNESESGFKKYSELANVLSPLYNKSFQSSEAEETIKTVKVLENSIKEKIKGLLNEAKEKEYVDDFQLRKLDSYLADDRDYLDGSRISIGDLSILNEAMNIYMELLFEKEFTVKKQLLDFQLKLFIKKLEFQDVVLNN
jgi:hypothetical protein